MVFQSLLISTDSDWAWACIRAAVKEESSAWLQAIPVSSLNLCLDNEVVHMPTGLHKGLFACICDVCQHCGA